LPKISNPHDRFSKEILSQPAAAAVFLANYLPKKVAAALRFARIEVMKGSFVDTDFKEFFSDLLYRVRLKGRRDAFVYVLIEHKSAPDKWVGFQLLRYMVKIWEPMAEERRGKLPPIIPLVLYHGRRKWRVARHFAELIDLENAESLRENIPNFAYPLCDLSEYDSDSLRGDLKLRVALLALKNVFNPDQQAKTVELLELGKRLPGHYRDGLEYLLKVLRYYSSAAKDLANEDLTAAVRRVIPRQEDEIMNALTRGWMKEGRQKGLQQGLEEGLEKGLRQGRKEGARKGAADFALLLLRQRLGRVSALARKQILTLSEEDLQSLGIALLEFKNQKDLSAWLAKRV
jgi:predicted transposase/invertase (TIGR01784 family)